jgi:hypothetical protein
MGFGPTWPLAGPHGLANRPGQPYPATFQGNDECGLWNHELFMKLWCSSFLILHSTFIIPFSGPPGTRTPIAWVQTKRLPFGPAAHQFQGDRGGSRTHRHEAPGTDPKDWSLAALPICVPGHGIFL